MEAIAGLFLPIAAGIVVWLLLWLVGQIIVGAFVGFLGGRDD